MVRLESLLLAMFGLTVAAIVGMRLASLAKIKHRWVYGVLLITLSMNVVGYLIESNDLLVYSLMVPLAGACVAGMVYDFKERRGDLD